MWNDPSSRTKFQIKTHDGSEMTEKHSKSILTALIKSSMLTKYDSNQKLVYATS